MQFSTIPFRASCGRALLGSVLAACAFSASANACSLRGAELFSPTLEDFDYHLGPAAEDPDSDGPYFEPLPAPVVEVVRVGRYGHIPLPSCEDAASISLAVRVPDTSTYEIEEFGVYFRVLDETYPTSVFGTLPLVGQIEEGKMYLSAFWAESRADARIPIDLTLEVFFVTNGLELGPTTRFEIDAAATDQP